MPRLLAILFVLIAAPTCVILAVLVPPGQVADEPAHIARAAALLHSQFVGQRRLIAGASGHARLDSGVTVDPNLWEDAFVLRPGGDDKLDERRVQAHRALPWGGVRVFAPIGTIAVYCPVFYLPGAAGLWAAQRLGIFPYDAILAGRLCAALCFVAMGAAALHLARFGRMTMFCALACPMTLSLAASFNQDGLLIAASALAAALATRQARLGTMLLIGGIATVKLPYLPLSALLLLPGEPLRRRLARVLLVALPALAWTAIMLATVAAPVSARIDAVAQAHGLLADPARLIWLPATTIAHDPWLLRQAIGILGWLNLLLPDALYQAWMAALPCAVLADLLAPRQPNRWGRALLLPAAILVAIWAIYFSQYLTWTAIGLDRIEGPTGRYFLPLVPLLGLALPTFGLWPRLRLLAAAIPVLAAAAGLAVLPVLVVGAYYLR